MRRLVLFGLIGGLAACGATVTDASMGPSGTDSESEDAAGEPDGSDERCPASRPDASEASAVEVRIRNGSDDPVYILSRIKAQGEEPDLFRVYDGQGEELPSHARQCVPVCGDDGVICPTQCPGDELVAIALEPGDELTTTWSGVVSRWFDVTEDCGQESACGPGCWNFEPAPAGDYELVVSVVNECLANGDPCDCSSCAGTWPQDGEDMGVLFQYGVDESLTIDISDLAG